MKNSKYINIYKRYVADRFNGLMINRLVVLLQVIFTPIYFIYYTIFWNKTLTENFNYLIENTIFPINKQAVPWIINLGIPILFSLPWVIFSIVRANRIANAYELMGRAMGKVRIDQKLFYGVNAIFVLVFIVMPYFSPIITIIAIFIVVRIALRKAYIGRFHFLIWLIPAMLISIIPTMVAFAFYLKYYEQWQIVYQFWVGNIDTLFGFGLSLAISIAIGNFILFLMEGAKQYGTRESVNYGFILVFKFALFLVMFFVYVTDSNSIFFNIMNTIAFVLGILQFVLARIKDVQIGENANVGLLMIPVFSLAHFLSKHFPSKAIVIVLASLIFFGLFAFAYRYAEDEELFG